MNKLLKLNVMKKNDKEKDNRTDKNFQNGNQKEKDLDTNNLNSEPEYIDPDDLGEEDLSNGYGGEDTLDKDYGYPNLSTIPDLEQNKKDKK